MLTATRNGAKNINVKRFKGLGEMNPEQFAESTLDPKIRNLTLVEWPEDEEAFAKMLDATMGDNLSERKALIEEYFGREAEGVELGDLDLDSDMDLGGVEDGLSEEEAEENKYVEAVVE